ncbi:MAG: N-acetylmuramoyl-L-alanine amidase, partial [Clostridiales bacterium]|nr:N-acetylmuramoyl-L-alanine amidase [Clostridiales bacterium]
AANKKAYGCETFCYATGTSSEKLAKSVQQHLVSETGRLNRGVKTGNFAVIKNTKMPAILVETAFIDNYEDNRFLASEDGKKACAMAMYKGILDYLGEDYNTESEDKLMSKEYDELKETIDKIKERAESLEPVIYNYVDDNMPAWAVPTITKLVNKGFLQGDENGLNLTENLMRQLVINDRAGIYGE